MEFTVCRDFAALRFARVLAPIQEGGSICAGGAGFTVSGALARCRAELAERRYELLKLRPNGIKPLGIAAHPESAQQALQAAYCEALETILLERLLNEGALQGHLVKLFKLNLFFARLHPSQAGYFALLAGHRDDGARIVAYSVRPSLFGTLLKTWEEYRNPIFHGVPAEDLGSYSKSGPFQGFSDRPINLQPSRLPIHVPRLSDLVAHFEIYEQHHIAYVTRKESEQ
jgi:hypothetical protein